MAIISTQNHVPDTIPPEFPKLMVHTSLKYVVLFQEENVGMVVYPNNTSSYAMGFFSRSWAMGFFEDYKGTVTLKNGVK